MENKEPQSNQSKLTIFVFSCFLDNSTRISSHLMGLHLIKCNHPRRVTPSSTWVPDLQKVIVSAIFLYKNTIRTRNSLLRDPCIALLSLIEMNFYTLGNELLTCVMSRDLQVAKTSILRLKPLSLPLSILFILLFITM